MQFTPDLMPGDVTGSLVYDGRSARVLVPPGPGVHQPAARRRDQPDPAEDPGLAAGGDGGVPGLGGRDAAPAARPVRGGRDPEPRRVRGHLPAARGPARPLPAQARAAPAGPRRRDPHARPARRGLRPPRPRGRRRRPVAGAEHLRAGRAAVARGDRAARAARLRRRPVPRDPGVAVPAPRGLPARGDGAAARRAQLGVALGPSLRHARRRAGPRPAGAAPPGRGARRGRARGRDRRRRRVRGARRRAGAPR